jgi:hypothetical protein
MNDSLFDQIQASAKYLGIDFSAQEAAQLAVEKEFEDGQMDAIASVFHISRARKAIRSSPHS